MTNTRKLILGLFTLLPMILMIVFVCNAVSTTANHLYSLPDIETDHLPEKLFQHLLDIWPIAASIFLLHLGLVIFYVRHVIMNDNLTQSDQIMWILLFIFLRTLCFIVYFATKILPEPKLSSTLDVL